jgi:DNA excision repair protein ERCC-4
MTRGPEMVVLVDTREKDPLDLSGYRVRVKRAGLPTGDYSVKGHHRAGVIIERKSIADLYCCMASQRTRFFAQLDRMAEFDYAVLMVEGAFERVLMGSGYTSISPQRMLASLHAKCAQVGVVPVFCRDRRQASWVVWSLLDGFWASRTLKPWRQ